MVKRINLVKLHHSHYIKDIKKKKTISLTQKLKYRYYYIDNDIFRVNYYLFLHACLFINLKYFKRKRSLCLNSSLNFVEIAA